MHPRRTQRRVLPRAYDQRYRVIKDEEPPHVPKQEVVAIQVLDSLNKHGSVSAAKAEVTGNALNNQNADLHLPAIERFEQALTLAGVTPEHVAKKVYELFESESVKIINGKLKKFPNDNIRLKAIEIWLKYVGRQLPSNNHLHLHGDQIDELLNKARGDQGKG